MLININCIAHHSHDDEQINIIAKLLQVGLVNCLLRIWNKMCAWNVSPPFIEFGNRFITSELSCWGLIQLGTANFGTKHMRPHHGRSGERTRGTWLDAYELQALGFCHWGSLALVVPCWSRFETQLGLRPLGPFALANCNYDLINRMIMPWS